MRRRLPDIFIIALLFVLPLILFWQQTLGGRTLIPTENLFQFEPFATYREVAGAPAVPHNALVSDLVLENYQWKWFIRESLAQGEMPLWNPYQFSGIPFFAAGQPSTAYPFSILYYVLPLTAAYGWFTVVQLWLAGAFMYLFVRGLGVGRFGALISGVVYQLSAFFVISAVFQMIIAAAVWLPLLLLMIENVIGQRSIGRNQAATIPWVAIGAVALGCNILAGHVEITYYTLLIAAYYAAARLGWLWWARRKIYLRTPYIAPIIGRGLWLVVMVALGIGLGAVQFIPLFEAAGGNFREGSASYNQVIEWAHPKRDVIQFLMPNFYGNPAHHEYVGVFTWERMPATVNALGQPVNTIDWGIKNYVEGALYLGILPLVLAGYALVDAWKRRREAGRMPYRVIFVLLTVAGLTLMFGLPTYALLYYGFPGINQLHSPFRWIFAVTLGVAVLAGFGADALNAQLGARARRASPLPIGLMMLGMVIVIGTRLSILVYPQIEPLIEQVLQALAKAPEAFADTRMFFSYQYTNIMTLGVFVFSAGLVLWLGNRAQHVAPLQRVGWQGLAVGVVALDLMVASWGFNPASDPGLLDFTPPAIEWLQQQPGDWRYTTLEDPTQRPIMNANVGWRYRLHDIRGYESIIPKQYVDYMRHLAPQVQLEFNRVAPLYTNATYQNIGDYHLALDSPLLDLLNVRYVMTHKNVSVMFQEWVLAYEDEAVRIWENDSLVPRAYAIAPDDISLTSDLDWLAIPRKPMKIPAAFIPATISDDTGREKLITVRVDAPAMLVVSETYLPGWRAYRQMDDDTETALDVQLVQGNFQGVALAEAGDYTIRMVYSPTSFQVGAFASFISAVLIALTVGIWAWQILFVRRDTDDEVTGVSRVARNSFAPIILNLFNRGIDFAFTAVMLRILLPTEAGLYQYAVVVFVWFDIFTNFGLNTFLTREVARDRTHAGYYFFVTSTMRLGLIVIGVVPLVLFLSARQALVTPPLDAQALLALGLLYIGLLPNSLSTGMTALFYAFEKAEYPSAVATLATINKTVCGLLVLLLGYGIVGLAAVSILTNFMTLGALVYGGRRLIAAPKDETRQRPYRDFKLMGKMAGESWPLMLNHFLATIFFQVDIILIEAFHGSEMVGQYGVAYKWLSALNVIPAFFTMAMLPGMSRQAQTDKPGLKRTYTLSIKLLVMIALPLAVVFTFLAYVLTTVLGGAEYLPDGAIATQLMIWSIPIGWMNSLTQYVLIALDIQRRITWAFIVAVSFNIVTNLILIPQFGYRAAALTTIASELMLLIPFAILLQRAIGEIRWGEIIWRPGVAAAAMFGVMALGWAFQPVVTLLLGLAVYPAVLLALRPLAPDEIERLAPLVPARLRNYLTALRA